jgi:hypothetical protein
MIRHHGNPVIVGSLPKAAWMTIAMKWAAKRAAFRR